MDIKNIIELAIGLFISSISLRAIYYSLKGGETKKMSEGLQGYMQETYIRTPYNPDLRRVYVVTMYFIFLLLGLGFCYGAIISFLGK